jgi:hypothetical protein
VSVDGTDKSWHRRPNQHEENEEKSPVNIGCIPVDPVLLEEIWNLPDLFSDDPKICEYYTRHWCNENFSNLSARHS